MRRPSPVPLVESQPPGEGFPFPRAPGRELRTALLAELAGTCGLVLFGTGAIVLDRRYPGALGSGGVATAFGVAVSAMILCFARVSGAHINPAVSLGLALASRLSVRAVPLYWVAQVTGALCGSLMVRSALGPDPTLGATIPTVSLGTAFLLEAGLTAFLTLTVLWVDWHRLRVPIAAVLVGSVVGLEAFFFGSLTGASMNPARSLGPAAVSGAWDGLWVYLAAPCAGALLAPPAMFLLTGSSRRAHRRFSRQGHTETDDDLGGGADGSPTCEGERPLTRDTVLEHQGEVQA